MTITVSEAVGSAYWAAYLINGDATELPDEEIALCDAWQDLHAPAFVVSMIDDEEPWFSCSYGMYTGSSCSGGECLTYVLHAHT